MPLEEQSSICQSIPTQLAKTVLKLDVGNCAIFEEKRLDLNNTELAKQVFQHFLENEILTNAKKTFQESNPKANTPKSPEIDLGDLDFHTFIPELKVLPLEQDLTSVLEKKSRLGLSTHENEIEIMEFNVQSELSIKENDFTVKTTKIPQKNKRSLYKVHSNTLLLQSPTSQNCQTEPESQTSSFSSISTILRGPCDSETENILPPKRIKRKRIIFCCVG